MWQFFIVNPRNYFWSFVPMIFKESTRNYFFLFFRVQNFAIKKINNFIILKWKFKGYYLPIRNIKGIFNIFISWYYLWCFFFPKGFKVGTLARKRLSCVAMLNSVMSNCHILVKGSTFWPPLLCLSRNNFNWPSSGYHEEL